MQEPPQSPPLPVIGCTPRVSSPVGVVIGILSPALHRISDAVISIEDLGTMEGRSSTNVRSRVEVSVCWFSFAEPTDFEGTVSRLDCVLASPCLLRFES